MTWNEDLLNAMVRHQVGLLQVTGSIRNEIWALLDASEDDLRRQITERLRRDAGRPLTPARMERLGRVLGGLRDTRIAAWDDVTEVWVQRMREVAVAEPAFMVALMADTFPVELGFDLPAIPRLRSIATTEIFMGNTLGAWAEQIAEADVLRIQEQVRIGMVQGETPQQMARRVVGTVSRRGSDGVVSIARNRAAILTRTATNAVAASARRELYAANTDLIDQELFTATLDSRTTPICRSLDGNLYALDDPEKPILPLHWGERSLLTPVIDGEVIGERPRRDFTQQQLLREYSQRNGLDRVTDRDRLPRGHKQSFDQFARRRMRELTGQAPAKLTYQKWLESQSASFQNDILGETKGKLFRQGNLTLDKFVARDGSELTLAELARREADAFRAAGLDPADFIP